MAKTIEAIIKAAKNIKQQQEAMKKKARELKNVHNK